MVAIAGRDSPAEAATAAAASQKSTNVRRERLTVGADYKASSALDKGNTAGSLPLGWLKPLRGEATHQKARPAGTS